MIVHARIRAIVITALIIILLAGCGSGPTITPAAIADATAPAAITPTSVPPTEPPPTAIPPTPVPPTATPAPTPTTVPVTRLDVASIPAGSAVYVANVTDLGITLSDQAGQDAATRRLTGFNRLGSTDAIIQATMVVDDKYRKGVAPLSLPLPPGNYVVFIEAPAGTTVNLTEMLEYFEDDSTHGQRFAGLTNGHSGVTYLVEIIDGQTNRLNQLWQPKGASFAEIENLYPKEETFPADEQAVAGKLGESIPADALPIIVRLLKKGGKLVYRKGDTRTILEVDPDGTLQTVLVYQDQ